MPRCIFLIPVLLTLFAAPALSQARMSGLVRDADSGNPVANASIELVASSGEVEVTILADERGRFAFDASPDEPYQLRVRRVGYQPLDIEIAALAVDEVREVEIRMGVDAVPIDPVVVIAPEDYEPSWIRRYRERAARLERTGGGRVITRADLEHGAPLYARDLISMTSWGTRCAPTILLDGLPADFALETVRSEEVEGVEIYRGLHQIPVEYYQPGMCALVLFWTRMDNPYAAPMTWRRVGIVAAVLGILGAVTVAF